MTPSKRAKRAGALADREYRHEFVAAHIGTGISFQVRANRLDRDWTQTELGKRANGMLQSRISKLEGPEHDLPNLRTLLKLAKAFDVALVVRFVPFSELGLGYSSPVVPCFDDDTLPSSPGKSYFAT